MTMMLVGGVFVFLVIYVCCRLLAVVIRDINRWDRP